MRLRIVTWNLLGLGFDWFARRSAAVLDRLGLAAPDVLCLQETTVRHDRAGATYDQAESLGTVLGLPVVAFAPYGNPVESMSGDKGGIAVVSRWPIRRVRNRRLPSGHEQPPDARVALLVTLMAPGGDLTVVTTHLSWKREERDVRLMQVSLLVDELARCRGSVAGARAVLAGDLNALEDEPALQLARERLADAFRLRNPHDPGLTWLSANPYTGGKYDQHDRRLDYVFVPHGVAVSRAEILGGRPTGVWPSDHLPVFAELTWPDT